MPLLDAILNASQPSKFHFASSLGMADEDHASLANLLIAQCEAKLQDLTLRDLQARDQTLEALFEHYIAFLKEERTMLTSLDLSGNKLSPRTCTGLADALEDMTLHGLTLARCWPKDFLVSGCPALARLVGLTSLVKLDLSHNDFNWPQESIFIEMTWCKKLQHLDLHGAIMEESNLAALAYSLGKLKLTSLCLPRLPDHLYERILNAAGKSLLFLRVDDVEKLHAQMPGEFSWLYPKYLDLRARVDHNRLKWKEAVLPSATKGMSVLLGHMGRIDRERHPPRFVPSDIATNAAHWAAELTHDDIKLLTLLNKDAARKE